MSKNFSSWPQGWPKSLIYPEVPVHELLSQTAERVPERTGLIYQDQRFTYAEIDHSSGCLASALRTLGIDKGDRVAIHLPNSSQFLIAYFGSLKAGAVFTPISPLLREDEMVRQLNDSGARFLITLDKFYELARRAAPRSDVRAVIVTPQIPEAVASSENHQPGRIKAYSMVQLLADHRSPSQPVPIDPHTDFAHLVYTGGTTGNPKAVSLTHFNVVANAMQTTCWFHGAGIDIKNGTIEMTYPEGVDPHKDRLSARDTSRQLTVNPWYHAMGIGSLANNIFTGTTIITLPHFDINHYLKALQTYRPTAVGGAPTLWSLLLNDLRFEGQFESIRLANSGAGPLSHDLMQQILNAVPGAICESYGMSECTMLISSNIPVRGYHRLGSVGLPVFDTQIKIVDPETGKTVPDNSEGEICIKGPQVMQGYWNQPRETAQVLTDGWLCSGDIGHVDKEGFLFITDRKKDMIIYKGYNVYPRELEEVLYKHPAVTLCAVLGKQDPKRGEVPVAFVQLKNGQDVDDATLMTYVNDRVAHYKKIRELRLITDMPVSGPGKVLKRELKSHVA
jgi:long-chain acyl-CoA synthetase